ncbi:unnamed protein product [Amoebophrya sp. A120]|nr:unnamed protein product [Amoebophrya sp. A120]|eukprot:GSA120T00022573001.1
MTDDAAANLDEQTQKQMEELRNEAKQAPGVGKLESLQDFANAEFGLEQTGPSAATAGTSSSSGSQNTFYKKTMTLTKQFSRLRKCRRDGNCFYRSYLFGMMAEMCKNVGFRKHIKAILAQSLSYCESAGYDKFALEEMHEEVTEIVDNLFPDDQTGELDISKVEQLFQSDDLNYPICFARCLTSSFMKHNKDDFLPFLTTHDTVEAFCMSEVDPLWKEADQLQIQALASYFKIPIRIFYLDQSEGDACTVHEMLFNESGGGGEEDSPTAVINFLYRPGHYELLYV